MKALEGLKILDFTTLLPGPYATLVLADLGAEVLKVSSPSKRDIVLEYEPFVEGTDIAANEAWLGRNKRNIFLNLKHPKAIAIVKQLPDMTLLLSSSAPASWKSWVWATKP